MDKKILDISSLQDVLRCFPVLKELRPHLTQDDFVNIYKEAQKSNSYEFSALELNGTIEAVMGSRVLTDFVRGRHLYIDDLVTSERVRSQGLGAELLKYAETLALKYQCSSLRLATGIDNKKAMKFYERNGWKMRSHSYVKKLERG